ncbi:MAG: YjjI family glycine radical enzyme [Erysipelotrichaceae bacterium]|nr:YjjI family glycine radical enzyme [Erysipelotrichaceae bacterium]
MHEQVLEIIKDKQLTYAQQLLALARYAENLDQTIQLSAELIQAKKDGVLCDLNEGTAPYRPRYIIPDYQLLMEKGSNFLQLDAPTDLWEACNSLLIMYRHVPSITSFPVYLGNLDELLEPFVLKIDKDEAKKCLRLFLINIDRTLTDSFVHANIGPKASLTGELLLELTQEINAAIPNLTLKYDPQITSDDFAIKAVSCMLKVAKPSFANHKMFTKEWSEKYAVASCYNGLTIGGGGFTLPRIRLYECAKKATDINDFFERVLPYYVKLQLKEMDDRVKFLVEESNFFKSNFLVTEGFVHVDNFTGMFGLVGLAEAVNTLLSIKDPDLGYGHNDQANALAIKILDKINAQVQAHQAPYGKRFDNHYRLHAQVGIDSDGRQDSPGVRCPIDHEPDMIDQIILAQKTHPYFPTGAGDIFKVEETWLNTPESMLDIIKGALNGGMRYFSSYCANNDVVRVTGYLVKRSELEKLDQKKQSLNNASVFGQGARDKSDSLNRRVY